MPPAQGMQLPCPHAGCGGKEQLHAKAQIGQFDQLTEACRAN
jgi:hypothetical protein